MDHNNVDIDELIKRIDEKILQIRTKKEENEISEHDIDKTIYDFDDIINKIDKKIKEIEMYEEISSNIDNLTDKINRKLNDILVFDNDDFDKTLYDLEEVSLLVKKSIEEMEKKKTKKARKAKYCELARIENKKKYQKKIKNK